MQTDSHDEDTEQSQDKLRPKRKAAANKIHAEMDSDIDDTSHSAPTAKPKREPNLLSSPSAMRIAAQRRSRRIAGLSAPKPDPKIESEPLKSDTGELKTISKIPAHKLPPKKRPRNTRDKHVGQNATPAVTPPKIDPGHSTGHSKQDTDDTNTVNCQVNITFKGLPKFKKARTFTCTVCKAVCDTQAGLWFSITVLSTMLS